MGQDQADIQICFENFQKKIGSSKHGLLLVFYCAMVKQNVDLRETRKQWFAQMEQKLQETYPKEEDRQFYCHSSEVFNPCIIAVHSLVGL